MLLVNNISVLFHRDERIKIISCNFLAFLQERSDENTTNILQVSYSLTPCYLMMGIFIKFIEYISRLK